MTEQTSRLVIEISSEQAKKNAEELSKELVKIFTGGEKASDSTSKLGKTIQVTSNITQNFNTTVNNTTKAVEKQTQELAKQEKQVDKTGLAFKQFASFVAGYVTIAGTISKADNYTEIQNRLKLVTKGQNELNQAMQDTFAIAQNTGSSWDGAVQVYQVFAKNAKQLGLNLKETAQLTDTVSKAVAISGASAQAAEAALVQFGQAIGSSVLRGDELNSILEQAPGLADAIAKGLGVTTSQLRTMGAAGQLTGEKVVEALQKASASVDELYGKTNKTIAASLTTLSNALTKYIGETANAGGSAKLLSDGILSISKNFELFASLGIAALMGAITAQITKQIISIGASTVAWGLNTRAIIANNTAQQAGLLVARSLSTAFLGPVGLGIAVAGVAASYLLLKKNAEDATSVLDVQKSSVQELTTQYLNLSAVQRDAEKAKLSATVKESADAYKLATSMVNNFINVLYSQGQISLESESKLKKLYDSYSKGKIGSDEFYLSVKNLNILNEEQIAKLRSLIDKNNQAKTAYDKVKSSLDAILRITPEAIKGHEEKAKAIGKEAVALQKLQDLQKSYAQKNLDTDFSLINIKSHGLEKGKALSDFYDNNKIPKTRSLTNEEWAVFQKYFDKQQALKKLEDDITESKRQQTKETENLIKTQQRLIGISGNSGIGTGAHLDVRYGGSRDGQKVSPEHIARLQAGGRSLSSYRVSSDYGQRKAPTAGASSFHKGIDFAMPVGTPITTKVAVKDVKTAYDSKGGGYYSTVTFEDGVVLKLLHQSPSMQSKVKGGASTGTYGSYLAQDKAEAKTEKEIETLRANYYSLGEKDEADHIKRVKDLRKNGLDSLIADENTRFEKTKQLRQFEFTMEVDGWRWVGEEKIKNDAYVKKLRVEASTDFNEKQKAEAIQSIEDQRDFELAAYKKLQVDKLNAFKASLEQQTGDLESAYFEVLAQNTMSKPQLARWQLQNQYGNSIGNAYDSYQNNIKDINKKDDKDQFVNDAEKRNEMLLKAEEEYQAQLKLIKLKGVEDEKALRRVQFQDQLSMWDGILSTGQNTFSQLAQSAKDGLGEQSSTYRTMFALQQGFSVASSMVAAWTAYAQAFADPSKMTLTEKFAGGAAVMAALMPALTTIASISMQGFATGGLVRGPGTGTSDSIPAYLSNGEHVATAWAVNRIGVANYDYMNRTGELPFQREYEALKSQLTMPGTKEAPKRFAKGGIVGAYNPDFERKQFEAISRSNQQLQVHQPQTVENVVKFIMVKDEEEAKEHLYSKDGEKAWLYHFNRNKSKVR
ncbi:tape measure protein [Acinetobacter bereziniae]|uniref:tape measure protein n=1 Tax=Acinetobacter bereziniae TaxID=106648 RepID=UPI0018FF235E|nr:tape measure protein [Acinetobacter bereziniae]MBJ9904811.1 tape measure protein [Acinetobacter bereziniae]MCU4317894.1 tape measure protein [Acinetobacter bereziniae]MCU4600155.1 tape measure protein [Acinetobacter bereziniae]